jgi:hypothetical protein
MVPDWLYSSDRAAEIHHRHNNLMASLAGIHNRIQH